MPLGCPLADRPADQLNRPNDHALARLTEFGADQTSHALDLSGWAAAVKQELLAVAVTMTISEARIFISVAVDMFRLPFVLWFSPRSHHSNHRLHCKQ